MKVSERRCAKTIAAPEEEHERVRGHDVRKEWSRRRQRVT